MIEVAAVVFTDQQGRVLTVRKRGADRFMLPGGMPEPGESFRDAAVREVSEEIGVTVASESLVMLGSWRAAAANESGRSVSALLDFWARAGENDARPTDRPEAVLALVERDPEALLVAEHDGRLVGTIIAGWDGWRSHLYRLAVCPDHRRLGIGQALLSRAEERLRDLGARRFDAMVLDGNELGQSIWAAAGYRRQDEWGRWVKPVG